MSGACGSTISLDSLPPGASGKIVTVEGGRRFTARLYQMGFVPGALVRVIANGRSGPVVVEVMGVEVAVGRGIARRVLVEVCG